MSDPFAEYIEFKYGGTDEYEFFEAFQGPFSEHNYRSFGGGFRFTGDPGSGDYSGSYFTGDHSWGASNGSSQQHDAGSQGYCGETRLHLSVLGLQAVPPCKMELKQVRLRIM